MRKPLWLPCVVVFVLSLFAPEIACIGTHLSTSRDVVLGKYHIRTPLTCIISGDQNTYLWTFSAPGIARLGLRRYLRREVPVSKMSLYLVPCATPRTTVGQKRPARRRDDTRKTLNPFWPADDELLGPDSPQQVR